MSSILQVLARRGTFFLFALLEIICFYLLIHFNSPQRAIADATWSLYANRYMERADKWESFFSLEEENQRLQKAIGEIRSQLPNASYIENIQEDSLHNDSLRQRYSFLSAEIINKSSISANITYVINRGHIHGVDKHQGVISNTGIVGIVIDVSPRYARVMSLLHSNMQVSAGLKDSDFFGSLSWRERDTRFTYLSKIPEYAPVSIGDTIQTTGYSNIFPTAELIGEVVSIAPIEGKNTLDIKVKLFNDFFNVRHVFVVRDLMKEDLDQLESQE